MTVRSQVAVLQLAVVGNLLFSAAGGTVIAADLATGEPAGPPLTHPGRVWAMLPAVVDGTMVVATSCADGGLRVGEVATGRTLRTVVLPRRVHRIVSVTADRIVVLDRGFLVAVGPV
jgi:hypothetical protein